MENMELYESWQKVPEEAKKPIKGGRLKGMTDINPMWRIKVLTERFGACGTGWYYTIDKQWTESALATGEITAHVDISLYYKTADGWSMPVQGTGGSMLVSNERNGLYTNDEAFKMATTDAISVACKCLGVGADVYWDKDNTKYNDNKKENTQAQRDVSSEIEKLSRMQITKLHADNIRAKAKEMNIPLDVVCVEYGVKDIDELTEANYGDCMNKFVEEEIKRQKK